MKLTSYVMRAGAVACLAAGLSTGPAFAGAERSEWSIVVPDYADCVNEDVVWDAVVREVTLTKETPSGQVLFMDHWNFEGTVTSSSGYQWTTRGTVQVHESYSLDNSLTGKVGQLENALLKSQNPGVPDMRLDVRFHLGFNASGELVVDSFRYVYHCVGN
jgi:hypothetical protein